MHMRKNCTNCNERFYKMMCGRSMVSDDDAQRTVCERYVPLGAYHQLRHGFVWGAANITRTFGDTKKGWIILLLETPKYPHGIQIYVTRTGKVRIVDDVGEWKKPAKKGKRHAQ